MNEINPEHVPQHYALATGQVAFVRDQAPDAKGNIELEMMVSNTLIITRDGRISAMVIQRIQKALQMNLQRRMEGVLPKVVDVVILAITPLGIFTKAEFNANSILAQPPLSDETVQ